MAERVIRCCVTKGRGWGGFIAYMLDQTVNPFVNFQFAPRVIDVPFLTITVHGPDAKINPGDSDSTAPFVVRHSLRMGLGGRSNTGGVDMKIQELGEAGRHMLWDPTWKWTDTTYG